MTDSEKLKRLAASYRKAGKLMEAKAVERAIQVLKG